MATRSAKRAPKAAAEVVSLPPIGIARFTQTTQLLEDLIEEKTDLFIAAAARYRARHQAAAEEASRRLTPAEAAATAAALAHQLGDMDPLELAVQIQQSELRAMDPPDQQEILLAAGLGTASALLDAILSFVALIEMPKARFDAGWMDGDLRDLLDEDIRTIMVDDQPVAETRDRAVRAFEHFASAGGEDPGKALGLIRNVVRQALTTAMLAQTNSGPSLSIDSPTPTTGDSVS